MEAARWWNISQKGWRRPDLDEKLSWPLYLGAKYTEPTSATLTWSLQNTDMYTMIKCIYPAHPEMITDSDSYYFCLIICPSWTEVLFEGENEVSSIEFLQPNPILHTQSSLRHMLRSPIHAHIHMLMTEAAVKGANLLTVFPLRLCYLRLQ